MTNPVQQIPFDLRPRTALGREDFMVAPCNRDAVGWIDRWPDWPAPAFVLYGPAAGGKTHLAAVWKSMAGAAWVDASELAQQDANVLSALAPHLVIDHLDPFIGDRAAETTLFHLYNQMKERGSSLLITMRAAPGQIDFVIPDLSSRLRAAPAVAIEPLDDDLLAALLVKLFSDRQVTVGADVIAYMLPRMERSFAAARDIVERADHLALAQKKPVTIPLLRQIFSAEETA
jgi:DnaA regulatory inactivator Hda